MKTYFARHASRLDIDAATYKKLWDEDLIAIHYPHENGQDTGVDSRSLNSQDYAGRARGALKRFISLGTQGGYVCAVYKNKPGCKVGIVAPGTKVVLLSGRWGELNNNPGREAILKTLAPKKVRYIGPEGSLALLSGRPRQGTFCNWGRDNGLVKAFVENEPWTPSVKRLSVAQQEVLCSEVMRTDKWENLGLPRLTSLLLPVGRTLKGIDIYGLGGKGNKILAQVTNYQCTSSRARRKLERLTEYSSESTTLVFFCDATEIQRIEDVVIFPLEEAFRLFSGTSAGKKWMSALAPSGTTASPPVD